jgi:hypothetical protein
MAHPGRHSGYPAADGGYNWNILPGAHPGQIMQVYFKEAAMRQKYIVIIPFLVIIFITTCQSTPKKVGYQELNRSTFIIGSLGKPLGEIIRIEGTIISGDNPGGKYTVGKKLLKVTKVNQKPLKKAVIIPHSVFPWVDVKEVSPNDNFRYIGYETGGMAGIPMEAFKHMPAAATHDFSFTIRFQVVGEMKD